MTTAEKVLVTYEWCIGKMVFLQNNMRNIKPPGMIWMPNASFHCRLLEVGHKDTP